MGKEIANFIKTENFEKSYFKDKNGTSEKFVKSLCNLMHSNNMEAHDEKKYIYCFKDFTASSNLYCNEYWLKMIVEGEKKNLLNI